MVSEAQVEAVARIWSGAPFPSKRSLEKARAALSAAQSAGSGSGAEGCAVPEGWKLVPVKATEEMIAAGRMARMNIEGGYGGPSSWEAMLDASPPPPARKGGEG